jgi:hypothetical protein
MKARQMPRKKNAPAPDSHVAVATDAIVLQRYRQW